MGECVRERERERERERDVKMLRGGFEAKFAKQYNL